MLRLELGERGDSLKPRTRPWLSSVWVIVGLVAALVVASAGVFAASHYLSETRSDARAAVRALKDGDLAGVGTQLAANRGQPDFAYFFTSKITPRDVGDALGSVAGSSEDAPFNDGVDMDAYELVLTDLGGTLALATHGHGKRALPESWTTDFIAATTNPVALYGAHDGFFDKEGKQRERQDVANRANLLLVLSRGYWSTDFLEAVTEGFYEFDRRQGADAWPSADPGGDAKYAPAPTGVYLTDGILALTAALTANQAASEWAFTAFLPGTEKIDGSEYDIGRFTHYLLFEHRFPATPNGESVGTTAALTAMSSAIESASWAGGLPKAGSVKAALNDVGPLRDAAVLQVLAQDIANDSQCSWSPGDYWNCAKVVAEAVWQGIQRWGHSALSILTLASFAPPPFNAVGIGAAAANSTWHAIEGDYRMAGLSLAAAVPGLAFDKIAAGAKAGAAAQRAAAEAARVSKAAEQIRSASAPTAARVQLSRASRDKIIAQAPKDTKGFPIDPNTGLSIVGKLDIGHKPGYEWRCTQAKALAEGWTRQQLIDFESDLSHYQVEDPSSNRSHAYESKQCSR